MKRFMLLFMLIPMLGLAQEEQKAQSRKGIIFQFIEQKDIEFTPTTGKCGYEITIKDNEGNLIENVQVAMVHFKSKTKFVAYTNRDGIAKFWLDSGGKFEVDIERKEAVDIIEIERIKYGVRKAEYTYSN